MQGNEVFDASIYEFYYTEMLHLIYYHWLKIDGTPDNPTSDIPRAGTSAGGYRPNSSLNVVDGSYLRLKNVTLNYDFDTVPGLSFIESASVYPTGNNLLLLTNYKWGDPEVSDRSKYSCSRVADDQYPYASSVALGFRLNL